MQKYQGPGIRYEEGKLGLTCVKDVKKFVSYLRTQATRNPGVRCWHTFGWYRDPQGVATFLISNLSLVENLISQPWSKGDMQRTIVGKNNLRVHTAVCPLSELPGHFYWYWSFMIRHEQTKEKTTVEENHKRRKSDICRQREQLKKQDEDLDREREAKIKVMEAAYAWQLRDEPENEEMPGKEAAEYSQGQGSTSSAAAVEMVQTGATAIAVQGTGAGEDKEEQLLVG